MINSPSQKGSAHVVVVTIIILVILGALGFVFWKNFMAKSDPTPSPDTSRMPEKPKKKSEIITLAGGDMNKYVNYDEGFEFMFPKAIHGPTACETSTSAYDNYGNSVTVAPHYQAKYGPTEMTVLEADGRYVMTPKEMVVLSDITDIQGRELAKACSKQNATITMLDADHDFKVGSDYIDTVNVREFEIAKVENQNEILQFVRQASGDNTAVLEPMGALKDGRQVVTWRTSSPVGQGKYYLWYYPAKKKLVYIELGQSLAFLNPKTPNDSLSAYDERVAGSFKFIEN